jgi:PAS domain S-box-containing protein
MNNMDNNNSSQDGFLQLKWLFEKTLESDSKLYKPFYGDVTELNACRLILDSVGKDTLRRIAEDSIDLLDTSVAIYEKNGDYAFGMFSSGWCQLMDSASRKRCKTNDNRTALSCGRWLCHDNCWNDSAKATIESGHSTDIQCVGGINLYAEPIYAGNQVIGAINIGYGSPPSHSKILATLAEKFNLDFKILKEKADNYNPRPQFLIDIAKKRLKSSAKFIGEIVHKALLEKDLSNSKALLNATNQMAKVGGWELDANSLEVTWTEETYRIHELPLNYKPTLQEAINFFHPYDQKKLSDAIQKALKHGEQYDMEVRFISAKSKKLWTRTICKPQIEKDKVVKLLGTFQDITLQKKILEKTQFLADIIEKAQQPIGIGYPDGRLGFCNPSFCDLTGYTADELKTMDWVNVLTPPKWIPTEMQALKELERTGEPVKYEKEYIRKDGVYVPIELFVHVVKNQNDDTLYYYAFITDITERKQTDDALRESEERFRAIFDTAADALTIHSAENGRILMANDEAVKRWGYMREELLKMGPEDLNLPEKAQDIPDRIKKTLDHRAYIFETVHRCKDGTLVPTEVNVKLIRMRGVQYLFSISRDISERKKVEEELRQSQKLEAIGTLAGGIAHDFNNMLGIISGNVSYLLNYYKDDKELIEVLSDINEGTQKSAQLTQQLLTFSKGGAPIKKAVNINAIIKETAKFVTRGAKAKCNFDISNDLWIAEVDSSQLNQVISNIVINANQAMPGGGIISFRSENIVRETGDSIPLPAGKYIKIVIEDQGIGISEKHLSYIFDPYFTTKNDGSGLGLATSFSIIKKHGGHITVDTELDEGTKFTIYLPASDKELEKNDENEKTKNIGKGKFLFMDDEEHILKMAGRMLKNMGCEFHSVMDGKQAIEIYQTALQSGKPFDLVILDLTIPGGMGGQETIQELLKIDPNVKAIVSSGYSNAPVMSNYKQYGFKGIIPKPYSQDEVTRVIHEILGENV